MMTGPPSKYCPDYRCARVAASLAVKVTSTAVRWGQGLPTLQWRGGEQGLGVTLDKPEAIVQLDPENTEGRRSWCSVQPGSISTSYSMILAKLQVLLTCTASKQHTSTTQCGIFFQKSLHSCDTCTYDRLRMDAASETSTKHTDICC